jgi:SAM-dependent methyltransferase
MPLDVIDIRGFYASTLGRVTQERLSEALRAAWPRTQGLSVMGLGFAIPYLDLFQGEADRVISVMPERQGVIEWPQSGPSASILAAPGALPFPDSSIDRALVIHALETQDRPQDLLSELWRVLTPGGHAIVVTPNRRGLWARIDRTPFGHGQPFSRRQLTDLLREALFSPVRWSEALHFPPFGGSLLVRLAPALEHAGHALALPFAGVHIVEATKLLYRPVPLTQKVPRRTALTPVLIPAPSPRRLDETPL